MVVTVISYFRASPELCKSPWAIIYCHIQFYQSWCRKRTLVGFDDPFSHVGLKTHAAEWAILAPWV